MLLTVYAHFVVLGLVVSNRKSAHLVQLPRDQWYRRYKTFRSAVVKPLLKKASLDPNNWKNFRPVSNLSFMSKITEKVVLQQQLAYLTEHKLICPSQSAYRSHLNTETALLKITNDILLALDSGNVSLLTLLGLSAVFDTID